MTTINNPTPDALLKWIDSSLDPEHWIDQSDKLHFDAIRKLLSERAAASIEATELSAWVQNFVRSNVTDDVRYVSALWSRIAEFEQNEVRWLNARDIWNTGDKQKDAKIAELEQRYQVHRQTMADYLTGKQSPPTDEADEALVDAATSAAIAKLSRRPLPTDAVQMRCVSLGGVFAGYECVTCKDRAIYGVASQSGPEGCTEAIRKGRTYCAKCFPFMLDGSPKAPLPPRDDDKMIAALVGAAQDVVERWDTPLWKDAPATATYINALRNAVSRMIAAAINSSRVAVEPVAPPTSDRAIAVLRAINAWLVSPSPKGGVELDHVPESFMAAWNDTDAWLDESPVEPVAVREMECGQCDSGRACENKNGICSRNGWQPRETVDRRCETCHDLLEPSRESNVCVECREQSETRDSQ